ncbi:MAG: cytochrome C oxidase subunit IV family protein [Flavobacteriaceae bacterium]|nr:cytochrome C oxidase subunit IV family protein [Flavobacteriaceae bacterium]
MNLKILFALLGLTFITAVLASQKLLIHYTIEIIIILSILKFYGVVFYFMELKEAHLFWKTSIFIFTFLFAIITVIMI